LKNRRPEEDTVILAERMQRKCLIAAKNKLFAANSRNIYGTVTKKFGSSTFADLVFIRPTKILSLICTHNK
jgi:hypothetical protein